MGKASRDKRERRALTAAADVVIRALQVDDLLAFGSAVDALERLTGASVFDIGFGARVEAAGGDKTLMDVAADFEAVECLRKLLNVGASRNSDNCRVWTARMNDDYDKLPPANPRWRFLDRLLRRCYEPTDDQEARQLRQWASEKSHRSRFSAMVLDLAGAFFAAQEQDVIACSIPTPPPSQPSMAGARRL